MTFEETRDFIQGFLCELPQEDCIVKVRYKYSFEDRWTESNEPVIMDDGFLIWENDWWEGQQDIEFLGYLPVRSIQIPNLWNLEEHSIRGE